MNFNLAKSAMLVSVTIVNGGLLGERRDTMASALVESTYSIAHRRAKASKYLIDRKHKTVKAVVAASQRVREVVYRYTMPWGDEKMRLLPVKMEQEFRTKLNDAMAELEDARTDYVQAYPGLVSASERDLGELFDATQYPDADKVKSLFTSKVTYWPIPESSHFVAEIASEAAKSAKETIETEIENRLVEATYDMVKRAKEVVSAFSNKLEQVKPESFIDGDDDLYTELVGGTFRDSLTENIADMARLIEAMNLTGNDQIKKVVKDLRRLSEFSAATWRQLPYIYKKERPEAKKIADDIMVTLTMLDLKDQEVADMVSDAADYMDM